MTFASSFLIFSFTFQEHRVEIDARSGTFETFEVFGNQLLEAEHYASDEVKARMEELREARVQLEQRWMDRRLKLDQCLELQVFNRESEQAETWMVAREQFLEAAQSPQQQGGVEALIKKHEDLDRAISAQEEKIQTVAKTADELIAQDHYDAPGIENRKKQVLDRWERLKAELMKYRSKLNEAKDMQGVLQDVETFEIWMNEMLRRAGEEQIKDPNANVQAKYQKHQVFEAEIAANAERLKNILNAGQTLIDDGHCGGHDQALKDKLESLHGQWDSLTTRSADVGSRVTAAIKQQMYNALVKDLEFWLSEMEQLVQSDDYGKDLSSVQNLVKKHQLLDADIAAHEERINDLGSHAEAASDPVEAKAKHAQLNERYNNIKDLADKRNNRLKEALALHQFMRDIEDEEAWIKEKKLLLQSQDYGRDLTSVQNLQKKHKRLEADVAAHEPAVAAVLKDGELLAESNPDGGQMLQGRLDSLRSNWDELKDLGDARGQKLKEALAYQEWAAELEEEATWVAEKQHLLNAGDTGDSLAAVQGLLKKHDAFEAELAVRKDRFGELKSRADQLINDGNFNTDLVRRQVDRLQESLDALETVANQRKKNLRDQSDYMQFKWKTDVVEQWIEEREQALKVDDFGRDLSGVQTLLTKQDTFDAGLRAFEKEGIAVIANLREQLVGGETPSPQTDAINKRFEAVIAKWRRLLASAEQRRQRLLRLQDQYRKLDELFLTFAKKASAFNSWFENAEEDLTDPVRCNSIEEIRALIEAHEQFKASLVDAQADFEQLAQLDKQIKSFQAGPNPYTWFTMETLTETWNNLQKIIRDRDSELAAEMGRQEQNDWLRRDFASDANALHRLLSDTRAEMMDSTGSLEEQLAFIQQKAGDLHQQRQKLRRIEELAARLEENLILDNRYTEHSALSLAQQWDQLNQLAMRLRHNLEQQIQARKQTGVTEESLKEYRMMFRYFDKDNSGRLSHAHFKSCLQALGIDLPVDDNNPEFQRHLDRVDPNREGYVSIQDYMSFLIDYETENVQNVTEIEAAFRALTSDGEKKYITRQELAVSFSISVCLIISSTVFLIPHRPRYRRILRITV